MKVTVGYDDGRTFCAGALRDIRLSNGVFALTFEGVPVPGPGYIDRARICSGRFNEEVAIQRQLVSRGAIYNLTLTLDVNDRTPRPAPLRRRGILERLGWR